MNLERLIQTRGFSWRLAKALKHIEKNSEILLDKIQKVELQINLIKEKSQKAFRSD